MSSELFAKRPERVPAPPVPPAPHSTIAEDSGPQATQAATVRGVAPAGRPATPGCSSVSRAAPSSDNAPPGQPLRSGIKAGARAPLNEYAAVRLVPASHGSAQTGAGSALGVAVKDAVCVAERDAETDMVSGSCAITEELRRAGIIAQLRSEVVDHWQPPSVCLSQHVHGGTVIIAMPPQAAPYDMHQSWHMSRR